MHLIVLVFYRRIKSHFVQSDNKAIIIITTVIVIIAIILLLLLLLFLLLLLLYVGNKLMARVTLRAEPGFTSVQYLTFKHLYYALG